jgi:hypothetical protein
MFLTGRVGWPGYVFALLMYPVVVTVIHVAVVLLFGPTLQPVDRLELGEGSHEA